MSDETKKPEPCDLCHGTGNAAGPAVEECFGKHLYVTCWKCNGTGRKP